VANSARLSIHVLKSGAFVTPLPVINLLNLASIIGPLKK
jgi:hypothetical protein